MSLVWRCPLVAQEAPQAVLLSVGPQHWVKFDLAIQDTRDRVSRRHGARLQVHDERPFRPF